MLLKGNSGFIAPGIHVNAPYDCNGFVFVEWQYRSKREDGHIEKWDHWKRMTLKRAKREKRTIIKCCQCNKPATQLDHSWPWMNSCTLCKKHAESEHGL